MRCETRSGSYQCKSWHLHVATAKWAQTPANATTRRGMGLDWLEELASTETQYDPAKHGKRRSKKLSWDTRRKILNLARCAFRWGIDKGLTSSR